MQKFELIIFAIVAVISAATSFDFVIFILKSAPKSSYFSKNKWILGMLCTMIVVYWFLNGYKFL